MEPETVLRLMQLAPGHYETVQAVLRYQGDGTVIKKVREQFLQSEAAWRTFGEPKEPIHHAEPDAPFGWRCRIWLASGGHFRQELELPDGGVDIQASTGHRQSHTGSEAPPVTSEQWHKRLGNLTQEPDPSWLRLATDTFWTMYPFDPQGVAGLTYELQELDLRVEGYTSHAGRDAVRLVGVPVNEWERPPEPLWWGADEYEVVVDARRGIVLRCASRLDGKDFDSLEVEEVVFDQCFGAEVFESSRSVTWRQG